MNYYAHHIGDFRSGSVHMTRCERWIYRDLIEVYYDTEKPLPLDLDVLCRLIGVRVEEERAVVADLVQYKFEKTGVGYINNRCDQEIASYHAKVETAKANGKHGGRPSKLKANPEKPIGFQSDYYPVPIGNLEQIGSQANQEPVTSNHIDAPKPPEGGLKPERKITTAIALQTFIENCKLNGERPLRDYTPLWKYAKAVGLDENMVALAWVEFCRRFTSGGVQPEKRQKDWRITFRKYVENNYFKLWAIDKDSKYYLTSQGKQAAKFHETKDAVT